MLNVIDSCFKRYVMNSLASSVIFLTELDIYTKYVCWYLFGDVNECFIFQKLCMTFCETFFFLTESISYVKYKAVCIPKEEIQ